LFVQTCTACTAGYYCKKDWINRIKLSPGQYAAASATSASECPAGSSCSTSAATACGTDYTYSGVGEMTCTTAPTFLRFTSSASRTTTGTLRVGLGYSYISGNDDSRTDCGATNYCPGDGGSYAEYSGLNINTAAIVAKPAGDSCTGATYSNGGIACGNCSPGASDRSQCLTGTDADINTQFAESFYNEDDEREGVQVGCLDSADVNDGSDGTTSGGSGRICDIEASLAAAYAPSECDGIRNANNSTLTGGYKVKHSLTHYNYCSWCPDDLNCIFHNSFFTFFRGYLIQCAHGQYSANGDLDCNRKKTDSFCKDGYYRAIHTSDVDDQWIHDQDKRYECVAISVSPSASYQAVDTVYEPD
jgi:hypothetical protein